LFSPLLIHNNNQQGMTEHEDACLQFKTICWPCYAVTRLTLTGENDEFFGFLFINK
jgi:hypothetical protein